MLDYFKRILCRFFKPSVAMALVKGKCREALFVALSADLLSAVPLWVIIRTDGVRWFLQQWGVVFYLGNLEGCQILTQVLTKSWSLLWCKFFSLHCILLIYFVVAFVRQCTVSQYLFLNFTMIFVLNSFFCYWNIFSILNI